MDSNGMYRVVQIGALMELSRMWNKAGKRQDGQHSRSWKHIVLALAVIATPLVLLVAGSGA